MKVVASLAAGVALVAAIAATPFDRYAPGSGVAPAFQSIGTLAFGPTGVMYAADPAGATIFALEMGATTGTAGTKAVDGIDGQIAAALGTVVTEIAITDLVVDPRSGNSYIAVMRGVGAAAKPALMRVDGAGKIEVVNTDNLKFSSITLPNPANANPTPGARNNPRSNSVTDMAFMDGKLYVAGLSNEEFASKLWSFSYPFAAANNGTSIEIYHGNHGAVETRSPVIQFVASTVGGTKHLIAGLQCTPLVKLPVASLAVGTKLTGTTIAELGAGNRPIDMVLYQQGGKEFILIANSSLGVMKVPTDGFANAAPITARVPGTGGVGFERVASLTGVIQLDKLNATQAVMLVRTSAGVNLTTAALP